MVRDIPWHPDQLYIPRSSGGRGLKSVESEYKLIKIKAAVKLCANTDPTLKLVREFEERAVEKGRRSMLKDASGFARELGIELELEHPEPVGRTENWLIKRSECLPRKPCTLSVARGSKTRIGKAS